MKSVGSEVIADIDPDVARDLDDGGLGISTDLLRLWEWLLLDFCFLVGDESPFDMVNVRLRGRVLLALPFPLSAETSFPWPPFWLPDVSAFDVDGTLFSALSFLIKSALILVSNDRILSRILCGILRESYDIISLVDNL